MLLKQFDENTTGTDWIIGDLHGCFDLLMTSLADVGFDHSTDRLFSVGDLIDRGPKSMYCLMLMDEPWFAAVRGNHEMMAYRGMVENKRDQYEMWFMNGGDWLMNHETHEVVSQLSSIIPQMPYAIEVPIAGKRIGIVHAQPPAHWHFDKSTNTESLIWNRQRVRNNDQSWVTGIDAVVIGHTPISQPRWFGNVKNIDTGAAFEGGHLTLQRLSDIAKEV